MIYTEFPQFINPVVASIMLGISLGQLDTLVEQGVLKRYMVGDKYPRFMEREVQALYDKSYKQGIVEALKEWKYES